MNFRQPKFPPNPIPKSAHVFRPEQVVVGDLLAVGGMLAKVQDIIVTKDARIFVTHLGTVVRPFRLSNTKFVQQ